MQSPTSVRIPSSSSPDPVFHRGSPGVGTVIRHLLGIVLLVGGLAATIALFLHHATGQWIDETALAEVSSQLDRYTTQSSSLLDALPTVSAVLAGLGIVVVLFRRHRFLPALVGLGTAAAANVSAQALKSMLSKPNLGIQDAVSNSMPSGHTTFAMACGAALLLAAHRRWRPWLSVVMLVFAVTTGIATVIAGWHRPADVIAAIFLVSAWTVLGLLVLRFLPAEQRDVGGTRFSGFLLIPLLTIGGLFLGFTALTSYVVAIYQHYPGAALLGSLCLIGAVGMLCTALVDLYLRRGPGGPVEEKVYPKVWTY